MTGTLAGIARRPRPRGPVEELRNASVTEAEGVHGNFRGAIVPGKKGRRQVSLLEAESWAAALAELGLHADEMLPWSARRADLLVQGLRLPREAGPIIAIGPSLRIEVTMECDPCNRMDELRQGLRTALVPDWRGGVLGRVLTAGEISVGDEVRIEE
ncbi:MOSC domain-containing protein [Novosphingobium sp. PC22D]|uniref:MOSC domain-containing protein n=1 Tax=Novosphingobium sp. PC22D TaxID=1962403 RepID=UPI000BF02EA5|nr:MOSC domain-containing protein [Novosphingobium sp. PC22D]PEQ11873.1 MOSC domain-containing protein [Novosphingobium sp. PC22D]